MKAVILILALILPETASATPTGQFIARWEAASRSPRLAGKTAEEVMATSEIKALVEEFGTVAHDYRRQILDARAAGKPPRACPPKEIDLTVDAVLAEVRTLPPAWRSRDFADSFGAIMDKRYPCGGASSSPAAMHPSGSQDGAPPVCAADTEPVTLRLRLTDLAERTPVVYETPQNTILFRAAINGHPVTVLLDNGASRTLIDRGFAARLGIATRAVCERMVTAAMSQTEAAATDPVTLEVARAFRVGGPIMAIDMTPIARALGRPVQAVLGADVLEHFAVMIDPSGKRLSFHQGGSARAEAGTTVVPIAEGAIIAAELGGQSVKLKIDLGSNGVIRLSDAAWRRVVPVGSPTRSGSQTTADGVTRATRIADTSLRMGTMRSDRVPVDSGYVPAGGADGLLGNGFLSHRSIILDLKGQQLLFLPPQQPSADSTRAPGLR